MGLDQKLYACYSDITEEEINNNIDKFVPVEYYSYDWDDEPNLIEYMKSYYNNKHNIENSNCIEQSYSIELDKAILCDILDIASNMALDLINDKKIRNYILFINKLSNFIALSDNFKIFYRASV